MKTADNKLSPVLQEIKEEESLDDDEIIEWKHTGVLIKKNKKKDGHFALVTVSEIDFQKTNKADFVIKRLKIIEKKNGVKYKNVVIYGKYAYPLIAFIQDHLGIKPQIFFTENVTDITSYHSTYKKKHSFWIKYAFTQPKLFDPTNRFFKTSFTSTFDIHKRYNLPKQFTVYDVMQAVPVYSKINVSGIRDDIAFDCSFVKMDESRFILEDLALSLRDTLAYVSDSYLVNFSDAQCRTTIPDKEEGIFYENGKVYTDKNYIRVFNDQELLFQITNRSKYYNTLKPLTDRNIISMVVKKKESKEYGIFYVVSITAEK